MGKIVRCVNGSITEGRLHTGELYEVDGYSQGDYGCPLYKLKGFNCLWDSVRFVDAVKLSDFRTDEILKEIERRILR